MLNLFFFKCVWSENVHKHSFRHKGGKKEYTAIHFVTGQALDYIAVQI